MRVLILSHMYPSRVRPVCGIFVHEQVKALVKKGCDVRVISPVPFAPAFLRKLKTRWKEYSETPRNETIDGIQVYHPRYVLLPKRVLLSYSGYSYYLGIRKDVSRIHQSYPFDVIHAHVGVPDGHAGVIVGNAYGKPAVVTFHGHDVHNIPKASWRCRGVVESVLRQASRVIVVSTAFARAVREYAGDRELAVVRNGYSPEDKCGNSNALAGRYCGKKVILSVGYLIPQKAHKYVLMAVANLVENNPDVVYVIVGKGPEEQILRAMTEHLGLRRYVEFVGEVPHRVAMEYMSVCNVFALPSWEESFGVVYVEAMAHGKPVIACRGEGIEDVIVDGETGLLVKAKDVESLTRALESLLQNPGYAKRIGEAAKTLVEQKFTWERSATKLCQLYEAVVRNAR